MDKAKVGKEWLSYAEAQEYAGIGRTKLWELVNSGSIKAAKVGRRVLISRRGLNEYLEHNPYAEVK